MLTAALVACAAAGAAIAAFAMDAPPGGPDFGVSVGPSTQTIYLGRQTYYGIKVSRVNGFTGPVRLHVWRLPTGTTATWYLSDGTRSDVLPADLNRARVVIRTSWTTPIGSRTLIIGGTGYRRSTGTGLKHSADVTLDVQRLFKITGNLGRSLYPGGGAPLNLRLTNPNDFPVTVTRIAAQVAGTDQTGCGTDNFRAGGMQLGVSPFTLEPGESRTLQELGMSNLQEPRIRMLDTALNQDACKGARLTLSYRGRGTW